jgi:hypothetical protein
MTVNNIVPKNNHVTNDEAKHLLAAGLLRAVKNRGRRGIESISFDADCNKRTVSKALALETLPAGETLVNLLIADASILDELFAHVGLRVVPLEKSNMEDLDLVEALATLVGALAKSHSPNSPGGAGRIHTETTAIADMARTVLPPLTAIVCEAYGIRGVA